jgi:hypothetical protein
MRQRLKEIESRKKINVESPNEIRELLGREPKEGMANNILQSNRLVPIDLEDEGNTNE